MYFANFARILRARSATRTFFLSSARLGVLCALCVSIAPARADTFGSGANQFEIEFVPIGDPGNPTYSLANPAGAVDYFFQMGKYEISESMIDAANALTAGTDNPLNITHDGRGPNKPASSVSWYEAARFVNWLNTSEGFLPAYKFDANDDFQVWEPSDNGYDAENLFRNRRAKYVLPSLDEWYKAAYWDPAAGVWYDYPTGSNDVPDGIDFVGDPEFEAVFRDPAADSAPNEIFNVGVTSPFGTAGQGGNVSEWQETTFDRLNEFPLRHRSGEGGSWGSSETLLSASNSGIGIAPHSEYEFLGFRIAKIPEPSSVILLYLVFASALLFLRRQ